MVRRLPVLGEIEGCWRQELTQRVKEGIIIPEGHKWFEGARHPRSRAIRIPICPHAFLVEECAQLAGFRLSSLKSSEHFCGAGYPRSEFGKPIRFCACEIVARQLRRQVEACKLVWTKEDEEALKAWPDCLNAYDKHKEIERAVGFRAIWADYYYRLEGSLACFRGIEVSENVEFEFDWPPDRLIRLAENHLVSLESLLLSDGNINCPMAPLV